MEPKSFGRYLVYPDGRVWTTFQNKFLKHADNKGYHAVLLHAKWHYVHRLVAQLFIENPLLLKEVNHLDCNKGNCDVSNLQWCSKKENMAHASAMGRLHTDAHMKRHAIKRLVHSEGKRAQARQMVSEKMLSQRAIARALGTSKCWVRLVTRSAS